MPTTDERGIVSKSKLTALASAIKTKAGESGNFSLDDLVYVVADIGSVSGETITLSAVFDAGENKIFTTDTLDDLKQYLTVTTTVDITPYVLADDAYALSGSLAAGENTITVSALGHTATFTVSGVISATEIPIDLSSFTSKNAVTYLKSGSRILVDTTTESASYKCLQSSLVSRDGGYRYRLTANVDYMAGDIKIGLRNSSASMVVSSAAKQVSGKYVADGLVSSTQTLRITLFVTFGSDIKGTAIFSDIKLIRYQEVS